MTVYHNIIEKQKLAKEWFRSLRDILCNEFELLEREMGSDSKFNRTNWQREGGGGGEMSVMRDGAVFEKVGVNFSEVFGEFSKEFSKEIPGTENKPNFWASGISLVAHMRSPLVPAVHLNTRMIVTEKVWFGGGSDLTPTFIYQDDSELFHSILKKACDKFDISYYPKFKEACDNYFYLPHRKEARGIGGIFYDYLNTGDWEKDFGFTREVGTSFQEAFIKIIRNNFRKSWTNEEKELQLEKRGRYVEFNLLYDRGTRFGLMTNGNTESILMSLPPHAKWI